VKRRTTWKGKFNWLGQVIELETIAASREDAFNKFVVRLAKSVLRSQREVRYYFTNDTSENCKLWEVEGSK
jgi:hypothetical protein